MTSARSGSRGQTRARRHRNAHGDGRGFQRERRDREPQREVDQLEEIDRMLPCQS